MHVLFALLLAAAPFWEVKPPAEWTVEELTRMVTDSPWAQSAEPARASPGAPPVPVFFATAKPMRLADTEMRRRFGRKGAGESFGESEYREFLEQDGRKSIVIAVRIRDQKAMLDGAEMQRMEEESVLRVGRRKYRMKLQFPPSAQDPFLRLVFPREVGPDDKRIDLDLYIPGVPAPYRGASFNLKEMVFEGRLEL